MSVHKSAPHPINQSVFKEAKDLITAHTKAAVIEELEKMYWAVDVVNLRNNNHYDAQQAIEERIAKLKAGTEVSDLEQNKPLADDGTANPQGEG